MSVFEMAKKYYKRGLWSAERIQKLFDAGKLTKEEYYDIINE